MTERVLFAPGGATEAKQDTQLTALSLLAREATLAAVGAVLAQLRDTNHADLVALAQQLDGKATDATLQQVRDRLPSTPLAQGLTDEQLRALAVAVQDDYATVLYLEQQTSTAQAPLLTFEFPQPVRKVWLRLMASNADDTSTATVRADGGDPTPTLGTVIDAGVNFPISTPPTTVIKVLPPVGKTVAAYGHTR